MPGCGEAPNRPASPPPNGTGSQAGSRTDSRTGQSVGPVRPSVRPSVRPVRPFRTDFPVRPAGPTCRSDRTGRKQGRFPPHCARAERLKRRADAGGSRASLRPNAGRPAQRIEYVVFATYLCSVYYIFSSLLHICVRQPAPERSVIISAETSSKWRLVVRGRGPAVVPGL